jgi:hypothetical protein
METILDNIEHVLTVIALAIASAAAWFARRAGTAGHRQTFDAVIRDACDSSGDIRQAFVAAQRLDLRDNGRRDFTDAALMLGVRAEFARRAARMSS